MKIQLALLLFVTMTLVEAVYKEDEWLTKCLKDFKQLSAEFRMPGGVRDFLESVEDETYDHFSGKYGDDSNIEEAVKQWRTPDDCKKVSKFVEDNHQELKYIVDMVKKGTSILVDDLRKEDHKSDRLYKAMLVCSKLL